MYPQNRPRPVSNLDLKKEQTARYFPAAVLLDGLCRAVTLSCRRIGSNLLGRTGRVWSTLVVCSDRVRILGLSPDLDATEAQGWGAWDDESPPPLLSHLA